MVKNKNREMDGTDRKKIGNGIGDSYGLKEDSVGSTYIHTYIHIYINTYISH